MAFLLNSENVFAYLARAGLWDEGQPCESLSPQPGKNFSLRVKQCGGVDLLVKQENHGLGGVALGEIARERWFYQLLQESHDEESPDLLSPNASSISNTADLTDLKELRSRVLCPLHFDAENSIIVFPFLSNVCDLSNFYGGFCKRLSEAGSAGAGSAEATAEAADKSASPDGVSHDASKKLPAKNLLARTLPTVIAASLGENFATLHRSTFQKEYCENFSREKHWAEWSANASDAASKIHGQSSETTKARAVRKPTFLAGLKRITPEMFCVIPTDALKFFRFYQKYPELGEAIEGLNHAFKPECVVHDDPRFANFLLHNFESLEAESLEAESLETGFSQAAPSQATVQLIDWEKWNWGDPAYDLAQVVANYLQLWLKSLPVSSNLDLATTLSRASVPLCAVQPSIAALVQAYFEKFPQILFHRPDFLLQLMRFTGLALIRQVQLYIAHKHPLGNVEMAMVQVAKSLLCQPEASIPTVFGQSRAAMESTAKLAITTESIQESAPESTQSTQESTQAVSY